MRRSGSRSMAAVIGVWALAGLGAAAEESGRDRLEAELELTVAVAHLNNGDNREALTRLEQALSLDPENGTAHFLAATALNRVGRYQEALPHLQRARDLGAQAPPGRIDWFEGEAHYWLGHFDEAGARFEAALKADPRDAYAHFYLGMTLLNLKRGKDAATSLDRAVALDASLGANTAYFAGKAYFEQGDVVRASQEFERALAASKAGDTVRKASSKYLAASQAARPSAPPKGEIRLGYALESDSNVILEPDNEQVVNGVCEGGTEDGNPCELASAIACVAGGGICTPIDESDLRQTGTIRGAYYPFRDAAGWSMGLVLNAFQSLHQDQSAYDLTAPQGVVSFAWGKDPLGFVNGPITLSRVPTGTSPVLFSIQYGFNYYWLDGDSYLRTHELGTSLRIPEGNWTSTQVDLDYRDNSFFRFQARTGTYAQARVAQQVYLGRRERVLRVGLRGATNDADEIAVLEIDPVTGLALNGGTSDDYDYDEREAFADLSLTLPHRIALFFQVSFLAQEYDNLNSNASLNDPGPSEVREDDQLILSGAAAFGFAKHWSILVRYSLFRHDSNKEFFEYDRGVASLGINWYF